MKLKKLKRQHKFEHSCTQCDNIAKYSATYRRQKIYYCKKCAEKYWEAHPNYRNNERTCTKRVLSLRKNATWAEKIFLRKLRKVIKVKFKFQKAFIKGGYYAIVDFHIPSRNICIEIDGGYHQSVSQKSKDEYRDKWLENVRGQKVVRLTNERAEEITLAEIQGIINGF